MNLELINNDEVKKKRIIKYRRDQLIDKIQQWTKENNRVPAEGDFHKNPNYPHYSTYQREFGSWNNALIAAGFKLNDHVTR